MENITFVIEEIDDEEDELEVCYSCDKHNNDEMIILY